MEYSKIANSYNELYREEQIKKLGIIRDHLIFKPGHKLLDVGCGTGVSTYFFEKDCSVVGVDPCKELLEQGKGDLILGTAEELPFEDKSFNIVISVTAIHNFENIEKGLREIKRVLKKDGQIALSILKRSSKLEKIKSLIKEIFGEIKEIEEEKDIIFFNQ